MEVVAQARGIEDADRAGGIGVGRACQHPLRGPRIEPGLEVLDDVAETGRRRSVGGDLPAADPAHEVGGRPERGHEDVVGADGEGGSGLAERDDLQRVRGVLPGRDGLIGRERPAGERSDRPDRDDPALLDVAGDRLEQVDRGADPAERPSRFQGRQHEVQPIAGPRRRREAGPREQADAVLDGRSAAARRVAILRAEHEASSTAIQRDDPGRSAEARLQGSSRRLSSCGSVVHGLLLVTGAATVRCSARLTLRVPRALRPGPGHIPSPRTR